MLLFGVLLGTPLCSKQTSAYVSFFPRLVFRFRTIGMLPCPPHPIIQTQNFYHEKLEKKERAIEELTVCLISDCEEVDPSAWCLSADERFPHPCRT